MVGISGLLWINTKPGYIRLEFLNSVDNYYSSVIHFNFLFWSNAAELFVKSIEDARREKKIIKEDNVYMKDKKMKEGKFGIFEIWIFQLRRMKSCSHSGCNQMHRTEVFKISFFCKNRKKKALWMNNILSRHAKVSLPVSFKETKKFARYF